MADLRTTYMGIELANPIIIGACGLTSNIATIEEIAANGAGAIVTKSLFEEQIQIERFKFDEDLEKFNNRNAEMIDIFPHAVYQGAKEHLMWVREAKKSVHIPVFASLNAVNDSTWIEYALMLQDTGVDGLEINLFASPQEPGRKAGSIEDEQVALVAQLKHAISVPISVKLSSQYTNVLNTVSQMDKAGAGAFIFFNQPFAPDIDTQELKVISPLTFSVETDSRPPLRCAALLEGSIKADICCSSGIMNADQVARMLLAGATTVQVVSTLYRNGIAHIRTILDELRKWMEVNNLKALADFRGRLSKRHVANPWAYTRTQYAKLLMNTDEIVNNAPVI